jgi:DNA-binding transcriptional MocR family regulator
MLKAQRAFDSHRSNQMTQEKHEQQGLNLDQWLGAYAARANTLSVSEVRALFAVVSRPEVVSLAGGMPYVSALPKELLSQTYSTLMSTRGDAALQYGSGQGDPILRDQIRELMALEGIHSSVEDLIITTGSQHGLDLLSGLFLDEVCWRNRHFQTLRGSHRACFHRRRRNVA